ncbi:hypothetical protein CP557_21090 [Natrinema ejinorense]|uniref:Uncharacterized protein n=1 Tax=Natrinema ejinorense TaxID=373386 RepID=A0A2A5QQ99_9EURY|nr:hypothetical protein CP557_21090 [Natrinema ejinorense]
MWDASEGAPFDGLSELRRRDAESQHSSRVIQHAASVEPLNGSSPPIGSGGVWRSHRPETT